MNEKMISVCLLLQHPHIFTFILLTLLLLLLLLLKIIFYTTLNVSKHCSQMVILVKFGTNTHTAAFVTRYGDTSGTRVLILITRVSNFVQNPGLTRVP